MEQTGPATALIVEDDPAVSAMVARHLMRTGFIVHAATGEDDAVRRAAETSPDLVVLDLMLSDGTGAGVCRRIRELPAIGDVPILVLTARDELSMKVRMFDLGTDDYIVKPCEPEELVARAQALLRRRGGGRLVKRIAGLRVALATGEAWLGERLLDLTAGERAILASLARAYPATAPRQTLDRLPWRTAHDVSSNVTEVLVARLRQKLAEAGGDVEIRTVRRTGYRLAIKVQEVGG